MDSIRLDWIKKDWTGLKLIKLNWIQIEWIKSDWIGKDFKHTLYKKVATTIGEGLRKRNRWVDEMTSDSN